MNKLGREKSANSPTKRKQERTYNWKRILGHREIIDFEKDANGQPVLNKLGHRTNIYNHVGGIYELKKPTQVDLYWAKDFLMKVSKHPMPGREKKIDIRHVSYNPGNYGMPRFKKSVPESFAARIVLNELMEKWPQLKADRIEPINNGKPEKKVRRKKVVIALTECALRGVNNRLAEATNKSKFWESRIRKMSIQNPKWKETMEKANVFRKEIQRLENRKEELETRLKNSY